MRANAFVRCDKNVEFTVIIITRQGQSRIARLIAVRMDRESMADLGFAGAGTFDFDQNGWLSEVLR